jgi:RNA polymerase sporulation-specific sigma factor
MLHMFLETVASRFVFLALHLTNTGIFPAPLSPQEEKAYLLALRAGDKRAKDKLVEHNLRLVVHVIKKYYANCTEQEDLISVGTIGLIKAINSFDVNKNTRLATYAAKCIENEILMYFRSSKKSAQDVSMNEPFDMDPEGNPLTLQDILAVDDTVLDEIDLKIKREKIYDFINALPDGREKEILVLRYGLFGGDYHTQRQVARTMSISRSYVSARDYCKKQGTRRSKPKYKAAIHFFLHPFADKHTFEFVHVAPLNPHEKAIDFEKRQNNVSRFLLFANHQHNFLPAHTHFE